MIIPKVNVMKQKLDEEKRREIINQEETRAIEIHRSNQVY